MADDKRPLMQRLCEDATSAISDLIYEKVNSLLGAGDQLFTMEFPARPLNGATYTYDADSCYSVLTKPTPVQEAEFILSNDLYDMAPMVQGTNGEKLSTVFSDLLNNYVPKLDFLKDFVLDKDHLREWLLTEVDDVEFDKEGHAIPEKTKISRMELCRKLYGEFLEQRNIWMKEKNQKYNDSRRDNLLEEYAQWVTTEALVRDEQLNNLFNDAVVRGNYHEVMTILGFLNIESPAEQLEKTKQNMRASVKRSLDDSQEIYPVQFQPTDWFKALRPNLHPKDLTMSSEALVSEYRSKQTQLRELESELSRLTEQEVSPERLAELKEAVAAAKAKVTETDQQLMEANGQGAVDALHMAVQIYKKVKDPVTQFGDALGKVEDARKTSDPSKLVQPDKSLFDLLENVATEAFEGMKTGFSAVSAALNALDAATAAQVDYAQAMTQNFDLQKNQIMVRIGDLKADLEYLKPLVSDTLAEVAADSGQPASKEDEAKTPLLPEAGDSDASDSTFMDVILTSESIKKKSNETNAAASESSSWKVGGWFFSAAHQSSSSSSYHGKVSESDSQKIEVGFRVTKVSIERGGWFNPSIFKMTGNYYRLADMRASGGCSKDDIRRAALRENADTAMRELSSYPAGGNSRASYLLPSFPTAFVIAKDITIRVNIAESTESEEKSYLEKQASSGGGLFGFTASNASSSKNTSESSYVGSRNQFIYIRIPGPQILGWFQQLVPQDLAEAYKPLSQDIFKNQIGNSILKMMDPNSQVWAYNSPLLETLPHSALSSIGQETVKEET